MKWRVRRGVVVVLVCLLLAVSCSTDGENSGSNSAQIEFQPGDGPLIRSRSVRIEQVTTQARTSPNAVDVIFVGGPAGDVLVEPCATEYELDVDNESVPPTVTVWQLSPSVLPKPLGDSDIDFSCTAEGHGRELRHEWLAGTPAQIVDGTSGQTHEVLAVDGRLAPSVLPAGWELLESDAPPEPNGETTRLTNGGNTIFVYVTLHEDPQEVLQIIRTGPDFEEVLIRDTTPAEVSTSAGRPQLRFVDGNYLYQISADQEVAPATLVEVATGMRP